MVGCDRCAAYTRLTPVGELVGRQLSTATCLVDVATAWLMSANVSHCLTADGLTAGWVPAFSREYSFGG